MTKGDLVEVLLRGGMEHVYFNVEVLMHNSNNNVVILTKDKCVQHKNVKRVIINKMLVYEPED